MLLSYHDFTKITKKRKYFYTAASPNDFMENELVQFHIDRNMICGTPYIVKIYILCDGIITQIAPHIFRTNITNLEYDYERPVYDKICELFPMTERGYGSSSEKEKLYNTKQISEKYLFDALDNYDLTTEQKVDRCFLNRKNCVHICLKYINFDPMEFYNIADSYGKDVVNALDQQFFDKLSEKIANKNLYKSFIYDIMYYAPHTIQFMDQSPQLCKIAVSISSDVVKYIKDPDLRNKLTRQYRVTGKINAILSCR